MKSWQGILLAVLLTVLPVLSACGVGANKAELEHQEAYRQALEEYQKNMKAYKQQQEAYQKGLEEGLTEYYKAYNEYQRKLQEQQLQQLQQKPQE